MLCLVYMANLVYVNLYVCKVILFLSFRDVDRADVINLSARLHCNLLAVHLHHMISGFF